MGNGITKEVGSGRKRGKLCNSAQYFANEKKGKEREPTNTGRGPGLKVMESGRFEPCPSPPPN